MLPALKNLGQYNICTQELGSIYYLHSRTWVNIISAPEHCSGLIILSLVFLTNKATMHNTDKSLDDGF